MKATTLAAALAVALPLVVFADDSRRSLTDVRLEQIEIAAASDTVDGFKKAIGVAALTPSSASPEAVYVPLAQPCRVFDSRYQTKYSPSYIEQGKYVSLWAFGSSSDMIVQGGNSDGCLNPKIDITPSAVAINVTAVGAQSSGNGNLVAWAYGYDSPTSSLVNYTQGVNIANSANIAVCNTGGLACEEDFNLGSNYASVHAIVDVMGYFYPLAEVLAP